MAQGDLVQRMLGAATLNVDTYEEVEADETATMQAAAVVAMVAVASAIGNIGGPGGSLLGAPIGAILGWLAWAGVTYFIGTKLFQGTATWGELLRTIGFAQSPGLLYFLTIVPLVGLFVRPVVWVWMLVAGVIAIRQALDVSTGKAVLTALLGFVCMVILMSVLGGGAVALGFGS
jgi:hypothetical protein